MCLPFESEHGHLGALTHNTSETDELPGPQFEVITALPVDIRIFSRSLSSTCRTRNSWGRVF